MEIDMKKVLFAFSVALSINAHAEDQAVVVSTQRLPECIQTIQYKEIYPRWMVKNACEFPVEILWCWKDGPPNWVNGANTCPKTGFTSSGLIAVNAEYEFPNRPYLANQFKPSAMLTVKKVCKSSQTGQCK